MTCITRISIYAVFGLPQQPRKPRDYCTDILPVIFKIVNSRRSGPDIENNMVNIFGNLEYQGDIKNFTYLLMYSYAIYICSLLYHIILIIIMASRK